MGSALGRKAVGFAFMFVPLNRTQLAQTCAFQEQCPLNMGHIERISCCSSLDLERKLDPMGSKRALEQRPLNMNHIERISCCSSVIFERNFDPNGSKRALGEFGQCAFPLSP
jgi:hypothetical protein